MYDEIRKMYKNDLIRTKDNFNIITDSKKAIKVYGLEKKFGGSFMFGGLEWILKKFMIL